MLKRKKREEEGEEESEKSHLKIPRVPSIFRTKENEVLQSRIRRAKARTKHTCIQILLDMRSAYEQFLRSCIFVIPHETIQSPVATTSTSDISLRDYLNSELDYISTLTKEFNGKSFGHDNEFKELYSWISSVLQHIEEKFNQTFPKKELHTASAPTEPRSEITPKTRNTATIETNMIDHIYEQQNKIISKSNSLPLSDLVKLPYYRDTAVKYASILQSAKPPPSTLPTSLAIASNM
jgi:hypothetical protein